MDTEKQVGETEAKATWGWAVGTIPQYCSRVTVFPLATLLLENRMKLFFRTNQQLRKAKCSIFYKQLQKHARLSSLVLIN